MDTTLQKDLKQIKKLRTRLKISDSVEIDECGDPNIYGTKGKLFVGEPFWFIYIYDNWVRTKKKLNFMIVSQDGDSEGILKLDRLPTSGESTIIRKTGGFTKKREISEDTKKRLVEQTIKYRFPDGPGIGV